MRFNLDFPYDFVDMLPVHHSKLEFARVTTAFSFFGKIRVKSVSLWFLHTRKIGGNRSVFVDHNDSVRLRLGFH